jgi:hypothetical protein
MPVNIYKPKRRHTPKYLHIHKQHCEDLKFLADITFNLQGTWGDIAGCIPYHVMVIHGIVAYFA